MATRPAVVDVKSLAREIDAAIRAMKLPPHVRIAYPPYMEGTQCECTVTFRNREELAAAAEALQRTAQSQELEQITAML